MLCEIEGRIRGMLAGNYPEGREDEQLHLDPQGDAENVFALPPLTEGSRLGESWQVIGTAVNAVSAIPTTAAHLVLYNAEPHNGKSYIITQVGVYAGTLAAAANLSFCVQVCTTPVANPAGAIAIRSITGRQNYRGRGNVKASVTVTNDAWHTVGNSIVSANAAQSITLVSFWDVYGRYVIPPGGTFAVASLVNTGTLPCQPYIVWQEAMLIQG